jgi:hypothetical protein
MENSQTLSRLGPARFLTAISVAIFLVAALLMFRKVEPYYTYFFLFAWWSYIIGVDAWLYLRGGRSIVMRDTNDLVCFLAPLSAIVWFVFEAVNLRLHNWYYTGLHTELWLRWLHHFVAFATVLPGLYVTLNAMDHVDILRPGVASVRRQESDVRNIFIGVVMLVLPLIWPEVFFALVWLCMVPLLDPINARMGRHSLIDEWRVGNWRRTYQLLVAGLVCGLLWECWNYWAGAHWVYSVPLPKFFLDIKYFQMPSLGFLGFAPFALECFVMTEFARGIVHNTSKWAWRGIAIASLLACLIISWLMDLHSVH